jgi:hypothetical protein
VSILDFDSRTVANQGGMSAAVAILSFSVRVNIIDTFFVHLVLKNSLVLVLDSDTFSYQWETRA